MENLCMMNMWSAIFLMNILLKFLILLLIWINCHVSTFLLTIDYSLQPLIHFMFYVVYIQINAKGFDNLPNRILKICSQPLATPFSLFNLILSSEVFPTSWKTATVIPIHKTGSQTVVKLPSNCIVAFSFKSVRKTPS